MKNNKVHKVVYFLGGGAHTLTTYRMLLESLSQHYEIFLFSEFHIADNERSKYYQIISVPRWNGNRRIRELIFGLIILKELLKRRVDIIHTHSTYPAGLVGIIFGKIFRKPVIVSLDAAEGVGLANIQFGDLLHKNRTKVNKYVINSATIVTALTKFHKKTIITGLEINREIKLIPRGIDCAKFKSDNSPLNEPIQFLNVGYINSIKDQITLLKCFAIICKSIPCYLTHIGKDYTNGKMKELCKKLKISEYVDFKGYVNYNQVPDYYRKADVLLHTSVYESQAMVVVEAFASNVLVCGTQVGLMSDLDEQCCITSLPGDYVGLALKVVNVLNDQEQMSQLKNNGLNWALKHNLQWTVERYQYLYSTINNIYND